MSERGGSDVEFTAFFEGAYSWLSRLAFLLTGSSAVADEIAQDACEQVFRRWDEIRHPHAYARLAVVNGARHWGRTRKRDRLRLAVATNEYSNLDTDTLAVRAALAELPVKVREVVVLRYFADMQVSEIASELNRPVGTVKSQIHRGLAHLKELMA